MTGLSLFAGAGGFDLGAMMAGIDIAASVEWSPTDPKQHAARALALNVSHPVVNQDCTTVDYSQWRGVDVVFGGPPCQGHSIANSVFRSADDPRNQLVFEMVRAARDTRARHVVIENVPAFDKQLLEQVLAEFVRLGYWVAARNLNAADYGVPQTRNRKFIIATKNLGLHYPNPTHAGRWLTIDQTLDDLWESLDRSELPDWLKPLACSTLRTLDAQNKNKFGTRQGRRGDEPFNCITRSCYYQRWQRNGETGKLGILASQRAQSFPDSWKFSGGKDNQGLQIGNAVPSLLAYAVLKEMR